MRNRKFIEFLDRVIDHIKGFVLALIAVIAVLGVVVGYRYYRYTQDDPGFCKSCHMMKDAFMEWQKGKHTLYLPYPLNTQDMTFVFCRYL